MVCTILSIVKYPIFLYTHVRGPDFRQAFRRIRGLRALSGVPFMSLTASAPTAVEADIVRSLCLNKVVYIRHPLNRSNIFLAVKTKSSFSVSTIDLIATGNVFRM